MAGSPDRRQPEPGRGSIWFMRAVGGLVIAIVVVFMIDAIAG